MSNVGKTFPSEITAFVDETSGRTIKQLTKTGTNVHFYFTENSYTLGDKEIIYRHIPGVRTGLLRLMLYECAYPKAVSGFLISPTF